MGIQLLAVSVGRGGTGRWGPKPWLVSVSPAPAALADLFFPGLAPAGNGASHPLARCQGRATEGCGSGWGRFVEVCSFVRVNFLSIIVSRNVCKTSTLIRFLAD